MQGDAPTAFGQETEAGVFAGREGGQFRPRREGVSSVQ